MSADLVVHVVDDDLAVRQSLAFLLATDGLPVRLHESAAAFLDGDDEAGSGCILTDVRMPGIDGIEFLRRLKERGSRLPVIVMTGHADVPLAVEAMKGGALDFIEKPFADDLLLAAIRMALRDREKAAREDVHQADVTLRRTSLTQREREVLERLVEGKPNKTIALELGISPRTV